MFNKGAQSMTFTVVDELKKRFPEKNIYLLSNIDFKRPENEKIKYNFNILPEGGPRIKLRDIYPVSKIFIKNKNFTNKVVNRITTVLRNTAFAIDISGYNLSSQFSNIRNLKYFLRLKMMKKYNIETYIFPQSIGPFNYENPYKYIFNYMIKKDLSYPKKIFVREKHGLNELLKYNLSNIEKNIDTVFYQNNINFDNIFKKDIKLNIPEISKNSVAIIPNSKLIKHNKNNNINSLYKNIIDFLLNKKRNIYIFRHSFADLSFCRKINDLFEDKRLHLFENDFNALELYELLNKFDYIVGSRYHSVVHSYKNNVPALVIGWAVKYKELTSQFNQEKYCFDIRNNIEMTSIIDSLSKLNKKYNQESDLIKHKLKNLRKNNIFDQIELK